MRIMNKEDIIAALKEAVVPDEEYYIDSEIIDAMLEYPDSFQFVKPVLDIISQTRVSISDLPENWSTL